MKKEMVRITSVVLIISLAVFLSLNLVSASWFSDFLGKITGNAVLNDNEISFMDWDGVGSPENKDKTINYELEAIKIENKNDPINISNLMIYSSSGNLGPYSCKYPCYNFTVKFYKRMVTRVTLTWNDQGKSASGRIVGLLNADVPCEDSDNGQDTSVKGTTTGKHRVEGVLTYNDTCFSELTSVREFYCKYDALTNENLFEAITISCPNGCEDGKCKSASPTCTPATCASLGKECGSASDGCSSTLNCGTCASGETCTNGACVATGTVTCDDVQDCPTNVIGAPSCEGNQLCRATGSYSCINPGTTSSYCNLTTGRECETCVNGCSNGACLNPPTPSQECTESDSGEDRFNFGMTCVNSVCKNDTCWVDNRNNNYPYEYLTEYYCSENKEWMNDNNWTRCPNGCSNGACKRLVPVQNDVCQNLIENVANPVNLYKAGRLYRANSWSNNYSGSGWWINDKEYKYNEYSANWWINDESSSSENKYRYSSISVNLVVFDDKTINLTSWIRDRTRYAVCVAENYWGPGDTQNIVYICNWDILRNQQSSDDYSSKSRQVIWVNDNVIVEMYIYSGESLTEEESNRIAKKRFNEFLNDLKDNQLDYVDWENFDVGYLARDFVSDILRSCGSDLTRPIREGTNDTCWPSWDCKIEPVICPPHGYQTKICVDYSCDQPEREEQIYCNPGLCSGCYVPRWIGSRDNKCIPYGFRFEQETEWKIEEVFVENKDTDSLTVEEAGRSKGEVDLIVYSDNTALLTLETGANEYTNISLKQGETYDWREIMGERLGDEGIKYTLYVDEINYNENDYNQSYIQVTFTASGWQKQQKKGVIGAYCDVDGVIKEQKSKVGSGDWAPCQNNYECFSNVCSGGECIDVQGLFDQVSGYKSLGVKILCRLSSFFSIVEDYESCVVGYLGGEIAVQEAPSSGGGGGGGSSSSSSS